MTIKIIEKHYSDRLIEEESTAEAGESGNKFLI